MHEMALCQSMIDLIEAKQAETDFSRVARVVVEIGVLGHVDPHALEFAFDVSARGTAAEAATLEIREIAGQAWCMNCTQRTQIERRGDPCPGCGSHQLIVEQGEEMRLKELEVV
jgi:hydrogenase nickel incorporation protein HypA/HybF